MYFEPLDLSKEEEIKEGEILKTIRHYLIGNTAYGETGIRDVDLEIKQMKIGDRLGNLHFIRFPTNQMEMFIDLCVTRKLHTLTFQVYATGGGAFKFESIVVNFISCVLSEIVVKYTLGTISNDIFNLELDITL